MPKTDVKLQHLAQVPLFAGCTKRELALIGKAADEVSVEAGRTLVQEGHAGHEFFLILDGTATVKRKGRKIASLGRGQFFGELSLLSRAPRNATVVADTPMEVVVLGQREFSAVLDQVPAMANKLLGALAARLREADARTVH